MKLEPFDDILFISILYVSISYERVKLDFVHWPIGTCRIDDPSQFSVVYITLE